MDNKQPPQGAVLSKSEDPFEVAATMFGLFSYKYTETMKNLDPKQLRKLILDLATNPTNMVSISPDQEVTDLYYSIKTALKNREDMVSKLKELTDNLSTGQLRRLSNSLVMYPLTDKVYIEDLDSDNLKEAHNIGQRLLEAKSMMFLQTVAEYEEAQRQTAVVDDEKTQAASNGESNENVQ